MLIFALLLAQADPVPAAEPVPAPVAAAEAPAATAAAAPSPEKVCRTRFKTGQGLIGSTRQIKVCKTRAEWAAAGGSG